MDELWEDYLQYLLWRGGLQKFTQYHKLFRALHNIVFTYIFERDDNRDEDGYDLREDYEIPNYFDKDIKKAFYDRDTSVLEVLIGLSIRVDNDFIGDPVEEHPEKFFMEMIKNFGLIKFKNNNYREYEIIKIVNRWMNREFEKNGQGSPFPVRYDRRDQRKLEIWDQMNSYINENYFY